MPTLVRTCTLATSLVALGSSLLLGAATASAQPATEDASDEERPAPRAPLPPINASTHDPAELPDWGAPERVETRMASPAMVGVGTGLLASGGIGSMIFVVVASSPKGNGWEAIGDSAGYGALGVLCLVVGVGAGVPLVVVGSRDVPAPGGAHAARRSREETLSPTSVHVGPGSAAATWTF